MSLLQQLRDQTRALAGPPKAGRSTPDPETLAGSPPATPAAEQVAAEPARPAAVGDNHTAHAYTARSPALLELKFRIHEELIRDLDPDQLVGDTSLSSPIRRAVEQTAEERINLADPSGGRTDCAWRPTSPTRCSGTGRSSRSCAIQPSPR